MEEEIISLFKGRIKITGKRREKPTEFDELARLRGELFEEICKVLRIPQFLTWLESKLK